MRIHFVGAGALVALTSACIPSRDNPEDPAVAPRARLTMIDMGPGLACPPAAIEPTDQYDALTAINRGRCLALDARESSDPQGRRDLRRFKFTLPPAPFAEPPIPETVIEENAPEFDEIAYVATSGLLVLRDRYRQGLPIDSLLEFKVKVYDKDGHRKSRKAFITLTDQAPRARIAQGFSVPAGGYPWALGQSMPLTFDGRASDDPENDVLSYCWTYAGTVDACAPESGLKDVSIPAAAGRTVVKLEVLDSPTGSTDNALRSRATFSAAWAEGQPLWEVSNDSALERIDTTRFPEPPIARPALLEAVGGLTEDLLVATQSYDVVTYFYPDLQDGPALTSAHYLGNPVADPGRNRVWTVGSPDSSTGLLLPFEITTSGVTALPESSGFVIDEGRNEILMVDSGGHPWVITNGNLFAVTAPGEPALEQDTKGGYALRFQGRPGTSEVWVLTASGDSQFLVYDAPGALPLEVPLGSLGAFGFTWTADGKELWVSTVPSGLVRLDAELLLALAPQIAGAVTADVPELPPAFEMAVDPVTGELWTSSGRVSPDLTVHVEKQAPVFIGDDGYVWANVGGGLRRGRSADPDRTLESLVLGEGIRQIGVDLAHGAVWGLAGPPFALQEITAEGNRGRRIGTLSNGSVKEYTAFALQADGRAAWATHGDFDPIAMESLNVLEHLDLTVEPPAVTQVRVFRPSDPLMLLSSPSAFAASPTGSPAYVWAVAQQTQPPYDNYPVRILLDGTVEQNTGLTISTQVSSYIGMVASAVDGAACIAVSTDVFASGSTYDFRLELYRAPPGGAAVPIDALALSHDAGLGHYPNMVFAAASRAPGGGEMCWTGYKLVDYSVTPAFAPLLEVVGAQTGMGRIRSFTLSGNEAWSVVPVSADEVWVGDEGAERIRMTDPDGAGVFQAMRPFDDPLYDEQNPGARRLVGAEAKPL